MVEAVIAGLSLALEREVVDVFGAQSHLCCRLPLCLSQAGERAARTPGSLTALT